MPLPHETLLCSCGCTRAPGHEHHLAAMKISWTCTAMPPHAYSGCAKPLSLCGTMYNKGKGWVSSAASPSCLCCHNNDTWVAVIKQNATRNVREGALTAISCCLGQCTVLPQCQASKKTLRVGYRNVRMQGWCYQPPYWPTLPLWHCCLPGGLADH